MRHYVSGLTAEKLGIEITNPKRLKEYLYESMHLRQRQINDILAFIHLIPEM